MRSAELRRGHRRPLFVPDSGAHWFWRERRPYRLYRSIGEQSAVANARTPETLTIGAPFGRIETIRGWIDEGAALARRERRIGPGFYLLIGGRWEWLGDVPRRSVATIVSDDDRVERLLVDVRRFLGAREWYATRGVPWRRGYLLHGPPGTGKSSAIRAVASELSLDIANLDVGRSDLTDDELREAMVMAPAHALIAIEDIDAVFAGRESAEKRAGVSFSGLLNAIDGVAAQEGRALFMTTNHVQRLDPALIRPGRADLHMALEPVGAAAAARLFARFFPGEEALAARFRDALGGSRVTPAALQGWLLAHAEDPVGAVAATGLTGPALAAE